MAAAHRSAWLIALGLSLGTAIGNGLARFAYGLVLPAMQADMSWSYTQAGWINTANSLGYLIGAVLSLRLIGIIGPHRLFATGFVLIIVSMLATGLTRDFWLMSVWRAAAGVGGAPVFIAGGAMVSALFRGDESRNAMAIAVYFGGGGLGMLVTGLAIPHAVETLGNGAWPCLWVAMAFLGGLAAIPALLASRAAPRPPPSAGGPQSKPVPLKRMKAALASYFLFSVGYIVYVTFLVAWMSTQHASARLVATTWIILALAVMVSPFLWRRVLAASAGGQALALSCGMTGIGTLLPLAIPGAGGYFISALSFGLSFFIVPSAVTAFGRKNLPEESWGRSVALFTIVFAVGQTLGPVAAGAIADATNNLTAGLLASGLTLLVGAAVASRQRQLASGVSRSTGSKIR